MTTQSLEFDYVIVGAGSAGAVIAARLSEDRDVSVLLLEAGRPDDHPFGLMPIAFPRVATDPAYVWPFVSEPEPGLANRQLPAWRGKTLGGCSSIKRHDQRARPPARFRFLARSWAGRVGLRERAAVFQRLEKSWRGASAYHGGDGPVENVRASHAHSLFPEFQQAARSMGLPLVDDHHAGSQDGLSAIEITVSRGRRASTARAYLEPVKARANLTVRTEAQVLRVLLEGTRATGVEYLHGGAKQTARAAREVVLCGGAYNSPQLLQLSGIGPAAHLQSVGITTRHDLPGVGSNLVEHPNLLNIYETRDKLGFTRFFRFDRAVLAVLQWYLRGTGPYTTAGTVANLFMHSRAGLSRRTCRSSRWRAINTPSSGFRSSRSGPSTRSPRASACCIRSRAAPCGCARPIRGICRASPSTCSPSRRTSTPWWKRCA